MRAFRRSLIIITAIVLLATIAAVISLRASLPVLDGSVDLAGLADPVVVQRDAGGVATIRGSSRLDLARATGFVHAQDRFFQMDLARRRAAGELAAMFGLVALATDRENRLHRFRHRAEQVLAHADEAEISILEAYAAGVNAGLGNLRVRPWEYLALGADLDPWRPEDSLLVSYSMFLELNDSLGRREAGLELLDETLPPAVVAFLSPAGTDWDAPMQGDPYDVPPIPGPEVFAVERDPARVPIALRNAPVMKEAVSGSNNWAVGGHVSAAGAAMVANDMHLGLQVPNTFYRLRLQVLGDEEMEMTGVSLPGIPIVIAGSNGRVAWGFTNSYGDWTDLIILEMHPEDPNRYRTPEGWESFRCVDEKISVAGEPDVSEIVCETIWGPVLPTGEGRDPRALRWVAHQVDAVNLELRRMESAGNVEEAVAVANRTGMPAQNIVIADHRGRIAWTIAGKIPVRAGFDGSRPTSWAGEGTGWSGWLAPEDYPKIIDPPAGRIWTANARVVDGADLRIMGDGGYALGARASRIRELLHRSDSLSIPDMLAAQLDDNAYFYQRWRDLVLSVMTAETLTQHPERHEFRRLVDRWRPRAAVDSVGFRLVFEFRQRVLALVFEGLTGPVRDKVPGFSLDESLRYGVGRQFEGPAWRLITERPPHLLHPAFESWEALLLAAVDATIPENTEQTPLDQQSWGRRNVASIRHPLSAALAIFAPVLDMPAEPLDGAIHMPRVQQSAFGASERFAVSPGREEEGYFHMPTGQSGHPLSSFYRAGHRAWVDGEATPFLPGPTVHHLWLDPSRP
jgi:penicillin amidase